MLLINIYIKSQHNITLKSKMINIIKCNQSLKNDQEIGKYKTVFCILPVWEFLSFPYKVAGICALIPSMFKILYATIEHYWVIRHIHDVFLLWCWRVTENTFPSFGAEELLEWREAIGNEPVILQMLFNKSIWLFEFRLFFFGFSINWSENTWSLHRSNWHKKSLKLHVHIIFNITSW